MVDWESMLGTSPRYAGRYDRGETATHEAGHWLNLNMDYSYDSCYTEFTEGQALRAQDAWLRYRAN